MVQCGLGAALLTVCAWLAIPLGDMRFTMQSFGIFLILLLLGGKKGSAIVAVYFMLGAVGLPVFSGFQGGIGVLLGPTGGYLWGFLAGCLLFWMLEKAAPHWGLLIAGMVLCYGLGSIWFYFVYAEGGLWAILLKCVVPYLLPDGGKLVLALAVSKRIHKIHSPA